MAKKKQKVDNQGIDLLENPEALSEKVGQLENYINDKKNRGIVYGVGALIVAIVLGVIFLRYWSSTQNAEAHTELTQAVFYFESDSLNKALNGDGNNYGFLQIIDKFGSTDAGNLSRFYAGAVYMKLESYDNAVRYLEDFSSSDDMIAARAKSLVGDARMELNDYGAAVSAYQSATNLTSDKSELQPIYLMKLAVALEENGDLAGAKDAYGKVADKHKKSTFNQDARKHKARLEGLLAE